MAKKSKGYTKKKSPKGTVIFMTIVVVVIGLIVALYYMNSLSGKKGKEFLNQDVAIDVQSFESEGDDHVEGKVTYKTFPPTSGNHYEIPSNSGFYQESPSYEQLVHSLEHGDIVIYYKPNLSEAELKILQTLSQITYKGSGVEVVPNDQIETPIVATAWTKMMKLDAVDEKKLRQFMYQFMYEGPEKLAIAS